MILRKLYSSLFLLILFALPLSSADIKLDASYQRYLLSNNSEFQYLDGFPGCCPGFTSGNSNGNGVLLGINYEIYKDLYLRGGFSYSNISGELIYNENTLLNFDGDYFDGLIKHSLNFSYSDYTASLGFQYKINKLFIGLQTGLQSFSSFEASGYERLLEPSDRGFFVDTNGTRSRDRNIWSTQINDLNKLLFFDLSAQYEINLNRKGTLNLLPMVNYRFTNGEIINGSSWNFQGFALGLGLNYYIHKDEEDINVPEVIQSPDVFFTFNLKGIPVKDISVIEKNIDLQIIKMGNADTLLLDTNYRSVQFNSDQITFLIDVGAVDNIRRIDFLKNSKKYFDVGTIRDKFEFNINQDFIGENDKLDFQLKIYQKNQIITSKKLEMKINKDVRSGIQKSRLYLLKTSLKAFEPENIDIPYFNKLTIYSDNSIIAGRLSKTIDNSNIVVNIVDRIPAEIPKTFFENLDAYSFVYLVFE